MQNILGRYRQMPQIPARKGVHQQRHAAQVEYDVPYLNLFAEQKAPRLFGGHWNVRHEQHRANLRRNRHRRGNELAPARRRHDLAAAHHRRGGVVRMPLDLSRQRQQPLPAQIRAAKLAARQQPARDRRRAAAKPARQRDRVVATHPNRRRRCPDLFIRPRETAIRQIALVPRQLVLALAANLNLKPRRALFHAHRIPDVQRHAQAVKPRPHISRGRRRPHQDGLAHICSPNTLALHSRAAIALSPLPRNRRRATSLSDALKRIKGLNPK